MPNDRMTRPTRTFLELLCAALVLSGCGGGGGGGAADTTPASVSTAYAAGPITGFGSVIVNGVRFDDSNARVSDDDGDARRNDELRLGMMVEIESSGITSDSSGARGSARSIRFGSEIVGPVTSIAADRASIVVLGQTVNIVATTLFDDRLAGGVAGLVAGTSVVEVHGLLDAATGAYTATRIEPKTNAPFFKLRGVVSNIDTTAHTFRIGSGTETISYDAIQANVPAALANGMLVRVKLQTTRVAGLWVATRIAGGERKPENADEAELEGSITASTFDADRKFSVNGVAVNAANAVFPNGSAGLVVGARVEVKGSAVNGVIVATRVSVEDGDEDDRERERRGFELHGAISALDAGARTFVLRGITVSFGAADIEFRNGGATDLVNGRKVEVEGARSSDGTTLVARRIGFED